MKCINNNCENGLWSEDGCLFPEGTICSDFIPESESGALSPVESPSTGSVLRWPDKVGFWWVRDKWDELYFAESLVEDGVMKIEGHGGGMMRSKLERHDLAETAEFVFIAERSPFTQNKEITCRSEA